jgi:hypothetical protein
VSAVQAGRFSPRCSAQVLADHDALRATARTECNEHSSRSHTIFQVRVRVAAADSTADPGEISPLTVSATGDLGYRGVRGAED